MAFTSLGVVLISTMTFVLGTFPEFQTDDPGIPPEYPLTVSIMAVIDNIAVGFFFLEYLVSESLPFQAQVEVFLDVVRDQMCIL